MHGQQKWSRREKINMNERNYSLNDTKRDLNGSIRISHFAYLHSTRNDFDLWIIVPFEINFLLLKVELPEEKFQGLFRVLKFMCFSSPVRFAESAYRAGNYAEHPAQSSPCSHAPPRAVMPGCQSKSLQHAAMGEEKLKAGSTHKISNLLLSLWSSRFLPSLSLLVFLIFLFLDFLHRDNFLLDYFWGVCCMNTHWPVRDCIGIPVRVFRIAREEERISSRGCVLYRAGLHRLKFIIIPLQATGGHSSTNSHGSCRVLKNISVEHEVSVWISPKHLAVFKFLLIMLADEKLVLHLLATVNSKIKCWVLLLFKKNKICVFFRTWRLLSVIIILQTKIK